MKTLIDLINRNFDPCQPVTPGEVARFESKLAEMQQDLQQRMDSHGLRQEAITRMQRALDISRDENRELATAIAQGQDLLERMRVRVPMRDLLPAITLELVEEDGTVLRRAA